MRIILALIFLAFTANAQVLPCYQTQGCAFEYLQCASYEVTDCDGTSQAIYGYDKDGLTNTIGSNSIDWSGDLSDTIIVNTSCPEVEICQTLYVWCDFQILEQTKCDTLTFCPVNTDVDCPSDLDCDGGGIPDCIEVVNGGDPEDSSDDCQVAIDAGLDICTYPALADLDCDGGGIINSVECDAGGNPIDEGDDEVELLLTKTADVTEWVDGESVIFTLTVENPSLYTQNNITVTDNLPTCFITTDPTTFTVATLAAGASISFDIEVIPTGCPAQTDQLNMASASSDEATAEDAELSLPNAPCSDCKRVFYSDNQSGTVHSLPTVNNTSPTGLSANNDIDLKLFATPNYYYIDNKVAWKITNITKCGESCDMDVDVTATGTVVAFTTGVFEQVGAMVGATITYGATNVTDPNLVQNYMFFEADCDCDDFSFTVESDNTTAVFTFAYEDFKSCSDTGYSLADVELTCEGIAVNACDDCASPVAVTSAVYSASSGGVQPNTNDIIYSVSGAVGDTFDIDWGDGNVDTGLTQSTNLTTFPHTYTDNGCYIVTTNGVRNGMPFQIQTAVCIPYDDSTQDRFNGVGFFGEGAVYRVNCPADFATLNGVRIFNNDPSEPDQYSLQDVTVSIDDGTPISYGNINNTPIDVNVPNTVGTHTVEIVRTLGDGRTLTNYYEVEISCP